MWQCDVEAIFGILKMKAGVYVDARCTNIDVSHPDVSGE